MLLMPLVETFMAVLSKLISNHQGLSSDLTPPPPLRSNFPKNKGLFLAFLKFPIEKKGIFKKNQKKIFREFPLRGKQGG